MSLVRESGRSKKRVDGRLTMTPPNGDEVTFVIEVKRSLSAATLQSALKQLDALVAGDTSRPMLAAPYLSPPAQTTLIERGTSYVDSTGNLRISAESPGLFISTSGATKNPCVRMTDP